MRNTHVLLRLIERAERKVGHFVVPTGKDQYTEAEIVGVGPGMVQAQGGVSETHDLSVGQIVYVKHKEPIGPTRADGSVPLGDRGIPYHDGQEKLFIVGESSIIAVLAANRKHRDEQLAELADKERNDSLPTVAAPKRQLVLPN